MRDDFDITLGECEGKAIVGRKQLITSNLTLSNYFDLYFSPLTLQSLVIRRERQTQLLVSMGFDSTRCKSSGQVLGAPTKCRQRVSKHLISNLADLFAKSKFFFSSELQILMH